jgi:hypothetical protein
MKAADVMVSNVVTVGVNASIGEVATILLNNNISGAREYRGPRQSASGLPSNPLSLFYRPNERIFVARRPTTRTWSRCDRGIDAFTKDRRSRRLRHYRRLALQ